MRHAAAHAAIPLAVGVRAPSPLRRVLSAAATWGLNLCGRSLCSTPLILAAVMLPAFQVSVDGEFMIGAPPPARQPRERRSRRSTPRPLLRRPPRNELYTVSITSRRPTLTWVPPRDAWGQSAYASQPLTPGPRSRRQLRNRCSNCPYNCRSANANSQNNDERECARQRQLQQRRRWPRLQQKQLQLQQLSPPPRTQRQQQNRPDRTHDDACPATPTLLPAASLPPAVFGALCRAA
jgi:hypothetical protein